MCNNAEWLLSKVASFKIDENEEKCIVYGNSTIK